MMNPNNLMPFGMRMHDPRLQKYIDVNLLQQQGQFQNQIEPVVLNNTFQQGYQGMMPPQMANYPSEQQNANISQPTPNEDSSLNDYYSRMHGYQLAGKQGDSYAKMAERINGIDAVGNTPVSSALLGIGKGLLTSHYDNLSRKAYNEDWGKIDNVKTLQAKNKSLSTKVNETQKQLEKSKTKQVAPKLLEMGTQKMQKKIQKIRQDSQGLPTQSPQISKVQFGNNPNIVDGRFDISQSYQAPPLPDLSYLFKNAKQ
jgi:hypothetical protein